MGQLCCLHEIGLIAAIREVSPPFGEARAVRMFFSNRSVKEREDILTNKLAANTHVIVGKTQIAQCAAINTRGDTWNIIRWWAIRKM